LAREARYLHADALMSAIHQASSLLAGPIERVSVAGAIITVEGGGQRVVFRETVSHTVDPTTLKPLAGGTSCEAILVHDAEASPGPNRLLRMLSGLWRK
jgi:hypothetical protein